MRYIHKIARATTLLRKGKSRERFDQHLPLKLYEFEIGNKVYAEVFHIENEAKINSTDLSNSP